MPSEIFSCGFHLVSRSRNILEYFLGVQSVLDKIYLTCKWDGVNFIETVNFIKTPCFTVLYQDIPGYTGLYWAILGYTRLLSGK